MRDAILDALEAKYHGEMQETLINIEIYLENPVGIGEHPEILQAIDSQLSKFAEAEEKRKALRHFR